MKKLPKILTLIFALSFFLLSACGATQPIPEGYHLAGTPEKGPYALPSTFEYYYWLNNSTCKDSWVNKAKSGDANFTGFEIVSEAINTDFKKHSEDYSEAMVTYHIFVKTITIENYLVNIPNQTVEYIGGSDVKPSQALDPNTILARANELAKTAPDLHIGALYTYFPPKYGTEEWSDEVVIQCDSTNSVIFTVPW